MAVRVIRENNRSEGLTPVTGTTVIAGNVMLIASSSTIRPYNDATGAKVPFGIAAESSAQLPLAPANGLTAGEGYDYTNFARGGLVSCFVTGSVLELFDDGHGAPYVTGDTYALAAPVYSDATGKITSSAVATTAPVLVGSVVDFDTATTPKRLRIKFAL